MSTKTITKLTIADTYFLIDDYEKASIVLEQAKKLLTKEPNTLLEQRAIAIEAKIIAKQGAPVKAEALFSNIQSPEKMCY